MLYSRLNPPDNLSISNRPRSNLKEADRPPVGRVRIVTDWNLGTGKIKHRAKGLMGVGM